MLSDLNTVFLLKTSAFTAASLEEAFLPASPLIVLLIAPSQQVCQCCGHSCLLWQVWSWLFAELSIAECLYLGFQPRSLATRTHPAAALPILLFHFRHPNTLGL